MCNLGSIVERHDNRKETARRLITRLYDLNRDRPGSVTLDLQTQIVVQGKALSETAAALEIQSEEAAELKRKREELRQVEREREDALRNQEKDLSRLMHEEVERVRAESEALTRKMRET